MRSAVELSDVHNIVLVLKDRCLVVVDIEIVGCAEDGHDTGEACRPGFAIHAVAGILGLVRADNGEEVVLLEEVAGGRVGEEV